MKRIEIGKPTKRAYGNEYPVRFVKNGKIEHSEVVFGSDLRYIDRMHTKEWEGAPQKRLKKRFMV